MGNKQGWYLQLHFLTYWNILWFCSLIGFTQLLVCYSPSYWAQVVTRSEFNCQSCSLERYILMAGIIPTLSSLISSSKGQPNFWISEFTYICLSHLMQKTYLKNNYRGIKEYLFMHVSYKLPLRMFLLLPKIGKLYESPHI